MRGMAQCETQCNAAAVRVTYEVERCRAAIDCVKNCGCLGAERQRTNASPVITVAVTIEIDRHGCEPRIKFFCEQAPLPARTCRAMQQNNCLGIGSIVRRPILVILRSSCHLSVPMIEGIRRRRVEKRRWFRPLNGTNVQFLPGVARSQKLHHRRWSRR